MTTRARAVARAPRRRTVWVDTILDVNMGTTPNQEVTSLHPSMLTENFDLTVVRLIASLTFSAQTLLVVTGQARVDIGIGILSQEAFAASVVPDPDIVGDVPATGWLWRTRLIVSDATASPGLAPTVVNADLSSMRKLQRGELALIVDSNVRVGTAFNVNMTGIVRVLFKR